MEQQQRRMLIWTAGVGVVLLTGAVLTETGGKWWSSSQNDGWMPNPVEVPPTPSYLSYSSYGGGYAPKGAGAGAGAAYGGAPPKPTPPPTNVDRCCFPIAAGSPAGACGAANRGCMTSKSDAGSSSITAVAGVGRNGTSCVKDQAACETDCGGIWCPAPTPATPP
eukprot:Hpha_TRINITY_DN14443_c0_g1::TRINITY_DN14443_c0_g1_i1::g.157855::m.157855